jgi:hypothetical protein
MDMIGDIKKKLSNSKYVSQVMDAKSENEGIVAIIDKEYGIRKVESVLTDLDINGEKLGYTISENSDRNTYEILIIRNPTNPAHLIQPIVIEFFGINPHKEDIRGSYKFADGYYEKVLVDEINKPEPIYDALATLSVNLSEYDREAILENCPEFLDKNTLIKRINKLEDILADNSESNEKSSGDVQEYDNSAFDW